MSGSLFIYEIWDRDHIRVVVAHNTERALDLVHLSFEEDEVEIYKVGVVTADVNDSYNTPKVLTTEVRNK